MTLPLRQVVVYGSGVVAWAAAAAVASRVRTVAVTVVDDPAAPPAMADLSGIATPSISDFHGDIGIEERGVLRAVDAVYRVGSGYCGWSARGADYLHCYGENGQAFAGSAFHQHWLNAGAAKPGISDVPDFSDYNVAAAMARADKFVHPSLDEASPLSRFSYGLRLDAQMYGQYLRAYAEYLGVRSYAGPALAEVASSNGRVQALICSDGTRIDGDLFVDCIGSIADGCSAARTDWSRWLPASRLFLSRSAAVENPALVERVDADADGWRLTAQLRAKTVHVSVSAGSDAISSVEESRRFTAGMRNDPWIGNVVAIGDAALTIEPIEGIPLHIAFAQIDRLTASLSDCTFAPVELNDYNRQTVQEAERLRDFVILLYRDSGRSEAMWRDLSITRPPADLDHDLRLWGERGLLPVHDHESFSIDSWRTVLIAQQNRPRRIDPVAELLAADEALRTMATMRTAIDRAVLPLPSHRAYLTRMLESDT